MARLPSIPPPHIALKTRKTIQYTVDRGELVAKKWPTKRPSAGTPAQAAKRLADAIIREVCELPNRTSPEDQPDALTVTWQELHAIIIGELEPALEARDAALRGAGAEIELYRNTRPRPTRR